MPAPDLALLGPLGLLAGTWEGTKGLDVSFHNAEQEIGDTVYRERVELKPFGPVDNGQQSLYGLDYRMAAWRNGEEDPFHTEVGYWLWDPEAGQVMRCFMVPRGSVLIAGGPASADSKTFTMQSTLGSQTYGILSNLYLDAHARTTAYHVTVNLHDDGSWSYEETSWVYLEALNKLIPHTDGNHLRRVS
jgi:hypothetical protein